MLDYCNVQVLRRCYPTTYYDNPLHPAMLDHVRLLLRRCPTTYYDEGEVDLLRLPIFKSYIIKVLVLLRL